MKSKVIVVVCFLSLGIITTFAQTQPPKATRGSGNKVVANDSLRKDSLLEYTLSGQLAEFEIISLREFGTKSQQKKYYRLVESIKKVYPYAKLAGERMKEYGDALNHMTKKERKDLINAFEDELKVKHGGDLKKLTFTQGRILLKLVDRETDNTPYDIVKDLKGRFQAFFWSGIASLFDYDLKEGFDPINNKEDLYIDEICRMIDLGLL